MFHPLIKLLATKPHLLAQHAGAYAELASLQAGAAAESLKLRAGLALAAAGLLTLSVTLAGVATLLLAVVPVASMPAPWLLAAAPLLPLVVAGGFYAMLRRQPWQGVMAPLREQLEADLQLLNEASQA